MQTFRTPATFPDRLAAERPRRPIAGVVRRLAAATAYALLAICATVATPLAETPSAEPVSEWEYDWTVLTMAPDGAWGVGSDMGVVEAITRAVGNCQTMTAAEIGCGGHFIMFRAAWSMGVRCGDRNILVAEESLHDAELSASWRAYELRRLYVPDLPPCVVVVTVDPKGKIVPPDMSGEIHPWR